MIAEIFKAVQEGRRNIVVVKARQLGITVALVIFTAFWMQKHRGLQGAFVADSDSNKEFFRDEIGELLKALPVEWRFPVRLHNRVQLAWEMGSHLAYHVAGVRENKKLGQSRGIAYLHATEVSTWGDPDGIDSLRASMSQRNPHRLAVWESTAKGYNHFFDMWQTAQSAKTHAAIFAGWWRHELYTTAALPEGDMLFKVYWDGRLTSDEASWQREISRRWGVTLTPEQWAWYRWMLKEGQRDENQMHQNYPTLPEHAFIASGQSFLGSVTIQRLREALAQAPEPVGYRYGFGQTIDEVTFHDTDPMLADLLVWEDPLKDNAHYIIAADPAFGASEDSDRSIAQVWRVGRGSLTQVAEFASSETSMTHFAWVIAGLAGAYRNSYVIMELNGPGYGVFQELERMQMWGWGSSKSPDLRDAVACIQHYLYKRPDTLRSQFAYQWKTTPDTKPRIMGRLRDQAFLGNLTIRSKDLVDEMTTVRQDGNVYSTQGKAKDDRVVTAALAVEYWTSHVAMVVAMQPRVNEGEEDPTTMQAPPAHERALLRFFTRLQAVPGAA